MLGQILGFIASNFSILAMQMKEKKKILILLACSSAFFALNYFVLQRYSGVYSCIINTVQAIIGYALARKNKEIPNSLLILFCILTGISCVLTYQSMIDILPFIASLLYTLSIFQKTEKGIRLFTLAFVIPLLIYTIILKAYTASICNFILIISTSISIVRYDLKRGKQK